MDKFLYGILFGCLINTLPFADSQKYKEAIELCEKSLPRDQQCEVIAIPDKNQEKL